MAGGGRLAVPLPRGARLPQGRWSGGRHKRRADPEMNRRSAAATAHQSLNRWDNGPARRRRGAGCEATAGKTERVTGYSIDASNRATFVGSYLSERLPDEEHAVGGGCVAQSRCGAARSAAAGGVTAVGLGRRSA